MLFHSIGFMVFFAAVWSVHWMLPTSRLRQLWLVGASLVFYGSWSVPLLGLLLGSVAFNFLAVRAMDDARTDLARRRWMAAIVVADLGLLCVFKYANFFIANLAAVAETAGVGRMHVVLHLVLPLGISFWTFEFIAYAVDVAMRRTPCERDPVRFALYALFFPRLIAGPVVRPSEFFPQLDRPRRLQWLRMQVGLQRFVWGFFKKAVLADHIAIAIDPVYADPAGFGCVAVWGAAIGYFLQVYCDFSGYSDMAIGLAHLLGYRLPENFRTPFLSADIREFWQRWHISLSRWIRDYLYFPLGGGRLGPTRALVNSLIAMTLCGLWHGASWTYVLWGVYNGVLMVAHRLIAWPRWTNALAFRPLAIAATFLACTLGVVLVRSPSLAVAVVVYVKMLSGVGANMPVAAVFAFVACAAALALFHIADFESRWPQIERRLPAAVVGATWALLILFCQFATPEDRSAFIYFQF